MSVAFKLYVLALSSTIGTGNIVGVATAIAAGGPGALFWMWIFSLFLGWLLNIPKGYLQFVIVKKMKW